MSRRRFIAGARCPKCHMDDRIVVYDKDDQNWMECVACGFLQNETASEPQNNKPKEIVVKWPQKKKKST